MRVRTEIKKLDDEALLHRVKDSIAQLNEHIAESREIAQELERRGKAIPRQHYQMLCSYTALEDAE